MVTANFISVISRKMLITCTYGSCYRHFLRKYCSRKWKYNCNSWPISYANFSYTPHVVEREVNIFPHRFSSSNHIFRPILSGVSDSFINIRYWSELQPNFMEWILKIPRQRKKTPFFLHFLIMNDSRWLVCEGRCPCLRMRVCVTGSINDAVQKIQIQ